jgi:mRNA interferase MazF
MVTDKTYVPERGDIVWLNFNPQTGHEQAGKRPAVVISPKTYNEKTRLAIFCPITSRIKDYPFEVRLPEDCKIKGVILADQVKNFDWNIRKAEYICKTSDETLEEAINKLSLLIKPF